MENDINKNLLEISETLKNKIWNETKKMWRVAGPSILMRFSTFGVSVISQAFVGHIGPTELAAYALVFTVILRFANSILLGMNSGLGTLCGQAYGAKQYHMLGIYLQQSWIVLTTTTIILSPLFVFASPILKALGQDEHIADVAGNIALWFIPVIFSYAASFSCQMYLQAQSKNHVISYMAVYSLLQHVFGSWLLTVRYAFGVPGAMVSTILAYWIPSFGQLVYVMFGGCPDTWTGFTTFAFKDLGPMIKLSLSSGAMICLELWYNSILILLTGNMKNAEVTIDALSICLNISGWAVMISIGFMNGASVRVSNELGRRDSKAAKFSILVIVFTSFAIAFVLFVFFLFFRGRLAYFFTKSEDVAEAVASLSPLLAFTILLNGVQPVLSGVANGAGRQGIVAYVNLGSYYLIGIPLGVILGYVIKLQVQGVWIGMIFGTVVQTTILVIMTYRTDWDKEVSLAHKRINRWFVEAETSDTSSNKHSGAA
ncbi:protein transparent testa 12 [Phtheirospermum japonicum]|uniref:Protein DETOXIFICATION n=1 Tax=Phtheirospermum japonicum TaxID=374723 RepID=A0A830DSP1_9LAMI|nr:protein transparent testa 12 [Phtheirospermum japonicum]